MFFILWLWHLSDWAVASSLDLILTFPSIQQCQYSFPFYSKLDICWDLLGWGNEITRHKFVLEMIPGDEEFKILLGGMPPDPLADVLCSGSTVPIPCKLPPLLDQTKIASYGPACYASIVHLWYLLSRSPQCSAPCHCFSCVWETVLTGSTIQGCHI